MPSSKRSPPAAAANRGCINERQWSDIRRAAALAQEKGVRLTLHGVSVMPADSTHAGGSPQRATAEQAKAPRRANDDAQPPETRGGVPSEAPSKKNETGFSARFLSACIERGVGTRNSFLGLGK